MKFKVREFKVGDRVVNTGKEHTPEWKGQKGTIIEAPKGWFPKVKYDNVIQGKRKWTSPNNCLKLIKRKIILFPKGDK